MLLGLIALAVLQEGPGGPNPLPEGPRIVKVVPQGEGFRLTVDGRPFFVKGAVGWTHLDELAARGGNAVRTGPNLLDACAKAGLLALVGLPLGNVRHGFDYSDAAAVAKQREETLATVRRYKDHPALLMWNIGNEPEIFTTPEQRRPVWAYVNQMAREIKAIDPNHPVIAVIGGEYREMLAEIPIQAPELDAVGLNSYADMLTLPQDVAKQGYRGAYLVTEFGPRGHWQVEKTPWGVPIEDTSAEKAAFYTRSYRAAIADQPRCLGSFAFLWSQKQEKTHTWYGMFLQDGSPVETVGAMQALWTGKEVTGWPKISPKGIRLATDRSRQPVRWLKGKAGETIRVIADTSGGNPEWELRPDVADHPNVGGDWEPDVAPIEDAIVDSFGDVADVKLPDKPGKYRLFLVVRNRVNFVSTANLPILVE